MERAGRPMGAPACLTMDYATLWQLRSYLGLAADETGDDVRLADFLRRSSRFIDQAGFRRYDVRVETRPQDYPVRPRASFGRFGQVGWMVNELEAVNALNAGELPVDDDLLAVTAVVNGDGAALLPTDYLLESATDYPKHALRLTRASGKVWTPGSSGDYRQVIPVTGIWGYHEDYDRAWADSLDTVSGSAGMTAVATTFTVTDADGVTEDRTDARFQAGQLIQLDSEYLFVRAVDYTANTLTVKRGANGTTAAAHAGGTAIAIYRPMETIEQAALRLGTWAYRQKDVNVFERITVIGTSQAVMPGAVPGDVLELLPTPRPMRLA
jgi:hypothetical protein